MRVLVTGASRGIGLEFVRRYAVAGHRVVACCRNPEGSAQLLEVCEQYLTVEAAQLDITSDSDIMSLAESLNKEALDLIINNAVHYGSSSCNLDDLDRTDWLRMFDVNCIGPIQLVSALRPALRQSTLPRVAAVSSAKASSERNSLGGLYGYRSSKAGLNAAFRSLAVDLEEDGIAVYSLSPGWIDRNKGRPWLELSYKDRLDRARKWRAEFGDLSARQTMDQAVDRMMENLERLEPAQSGGFFDHLGEPMPW